MDMTSDPLTAPAAPVAASAAMPATAPAGQWISLILATYGRSTELAIVLDSLAAQTDKGFEIIVVDQNPDDRLEPVLAVERGLTIRHLRQEQPNLSLARNAGLAAATGQWVAFPDDDCWYEPECLAQVHQAILADNNLDGVVGRWVEVAPGDVPDQHHLSLSAWRDFRGGDASSITLFLRREAVQALAGFDTRIGVGQYFGAGEETDLLLRMLDQNRDLLYLPQARVHHHFSHEPVPVSARALAAQRSRARGVGAIYAKHRLGTKTIVRGLLAPVIKPLGGRQPVAGLLFGLAAVLGRLEGMFGWRRQGPPARTDSEGS